MIAPKPQYWCQIDTDRVSTKKYKQNNFNNNFFYEFLFDILLIIINLSTPKKLN